MSQREKGMIALYINEQTLNKALATAEHKRLRANLKELNKQFNIAKSQGYEDIEFFKSGKKNIELLTGKSKSGKLILGKASGNKAREKDLLDLTDKMLESKWLTEQGREMIWKQSFSTLSERTGITKKQALQFYDVMNTDIFSKLKEKFDLDSKQIVKMSIKRGARKKDSLADIFERGYEKAKADQEQGKEWMREDWQRYLNEDTDGIGVYFSKKRN